ncbi:TPA: type II secretion system F family protein [archaeon]|uniref:Type II secretion system F family protein n=1 Tax=Candidatus Naiadarchaeum limnaeum TaxID=2756139 RepID=A0A832XI98_9ARCH|nr:type II secretion system F family protein [Candidatus Naiadarchaeales archaeon SRR2090153.bin1042]HIK00471.1 type II secretion system F family protein [Candidatus Naiadarchaeum limnaeum]
MPDIIPFIPFKLDKAKKVSQSFRGAAQKLLKYFPNLEINLIQGRVDIEAVSYLSIILFSTIFWFSLITAVMFGAVLIATPAQIIANLYLIFLVSGSVTILAFFYLVFYPLVRARARTRTLERDLLFALRHGLIEVKSGVTLFNTMASIAKGGYGIVSEEFSKIVKQINAGVPEEVALERSAFANPSLQLRQVIWQLSNSLKAGADIGVTLETLVGEFEQEQLIIIRKYGREMNPWTMMYMMMGIILPSLGITFFIVISAFAGSVAGKEIFYLIVIMVVFFQVFFLSFMKTKRPMVIT